MRRSSLVAGLLLALALGAAGCDAQTATSTPVPTPTPTGVLLTVSARGGLCPGGTCETSIFVERDGRVHQAAKPPNDLGEVDPAALVALEQAIGATDFAELRSHPFTGQCPTAFDGQELIFEFGTPTAVERIATCEVEVDFGSPLFVAVAAAVGQYIALPSP